MLVVAKEYFASRYSRSLLQAFKVGLQMLVYINTGQRFFAQRNYSNLQKQLLIIIVFVIINMF